MGIFNMVRSLGASVIERDTHLYKLDSSVDTFGKMA